MYVCICIYVYRILTLFLRTCLKVAMSFLILNGLFIGVIVDNFTNIIYISVYAYICVYTHVYLYASN